MLYIFKGNNLTSPSHTLVEHGREEHSPFFAGISGWKADTQWELITRPLDFAQKHLDLTFGLSINVL